MGKPSRFSKSKFYQLRTKLGWNIRKVSNETGVPEPLLSDFEGELIRANDDIKCAIKHMEGLRDERA